MSVDLSTRYLGLELSNPLVVGACPLTGHLTTLERLAIAGAAAAVMPSLFEEQIEGEDADFHLQLSAKPTFLDQQARLPNMDNYNMGPEGCLRHIELAKKSLSIPIIGSLNGTSRSGWIKFARLIEQAGADALELNIFLISTDVTASTQEVENCYVDVVAAVRDSISIPLAVKIGPYFAALPYFAKRLADAGADGLVLFNRFLEPEFDLDKFHVEPHLELSHHSELRLPLRWIAVLRDQLDVSLAATSGIHDSRDMVKSLMAGADVSMLASAILRHGPDHVSTMLVGLRRWLEDHEFASVDSIKGFLSRGKSSDSTAFERANYMRALSSYTGPFA